MGYRNESYTPAQSQCILSIFEILAPNKEAFYWGTGKDNWIDGELNHEYGIYSASKDRVDNFFPAYKLLNLYFLQQIVLFARVTFFERLPREADTIKIPGDWTVKNEQDMMRFNRKPQYQYLVDRLQFLFADDLEVGELVRTLVVPVD